MTKVLGEYLRSLVWPLALNNHYTERGVTSLKDIGFLFGLICIVVWVAVSWRSRWSLFAGVWFLICLAPVLQLVSHPTLRADRYLYVAALGIFWTVAAGLWEGHSCPERTSASSVEPSRQECRSHNRTCLVVGIVFAVGLLGLTWSRVPVWHDARSLWSDCVAKNPNSVVGHFSLAGGYIRQRDWPAAETELRLTLALREGFAEAQARLGGVLLMQGKRKEARQHLQRALELDPSLSEARENLALLQ